nr:UBN2 domain-containing protein [Tanacetum cinerariifolium]
MNKFAISKDESIDSAFARFNTIIISLKALDEGYSSKNYVSKFLRALHPKWRAKDLIGECPKPPKDKNQRAIVRGSWSDSGEEDDEKVNNKICLVAQASSEYKVFSSTNCLDSVNSLAVLSLLRLSPSFELPSPAIESAIWSSLYNGTNFLILSMAPSGGVTEDIYKYKIRVRKDEDEEMINAEVNDSDKGDEEITDAAKANAEKTSEVKDDPQKTKLPPTSSSLSVSSCFGNQFLKLSFDSSLVSTVKDTTDTKINSLLEVKVQSEVSHTQSLFVLNVPLRVAKLEKDVSDLKKIDLFTEAVIALKTQVSSIVDNYLGSKVGDTPTIDLEQGFKKSALEILKIKREQAEKQQKPKFTIKSIDQAALEEYDLKISLYQTMHANKSFNRNPANYQLYHALMEALIEYENAMIKGVTDTIKDHKESMMMMKMMMMMMMKTLQLDQTRVSRPRGDELKSPSLPRSHPPPRKPQKECFNTLIDKLHWNNPEGDRYPFDLSKPLPRQGPLDHRTVVVDYFFNNDLEYLKTSDLEVKYTMSITKIKATRYEIKGIEYMVPTLWSTIKHAYKKDVEKGIKHQGKRRKLWYRSYVCKFSNHNVFSTKAILGVKSVSFKKLHGYGHLEEIVVKIYDQQLYKFKEGDFIDLHLNDIEDKILLDVQYKLFHLDESDVVDFIVALRMFTRSLILKRHVEDLQLGIESYKKKLNITKHQKTFLELNSKNPTLHHTIYHKLSMKT